MRILVCCPLKTGTSKNGRDLGSAFAELGHEVAYVDIDHRLWRHRLLPRALRSADWLDKDDAAFNRLLLKRTRRFAPALLLAIKPLRLFAETLTAIRAQGIETAAYWIDDPLDFDRSWPLAGRFDHYFTNDESSLSRYADHGLSVHHLASAVNLAHFTPLPLPIVYPISFIGTHSPYRQGILERMELPVHVFGPGWDKAKGGNLIVHPPVYGQLTVKTYRQSAVNLNIHNWQGQGSAMNLRLFEVLACGSLLLSDFVTEAAQHFDDGKHLLFWRNESELRQQAVRYAADIEAGRAIGEAGRKHVQSHHSYHQRAKQLLAVIAKHPAA